MLQKKTYYKYFFQKSHEKGGSGFTCSLSTCGHHMSSAEVSRKLQKVRIALESAVELMEKEMPGACGKTTS